VGPLSPSKETPILKKEKGRTGLKKRGRSHQGEEKGVVSENRDPRATKGGSNGGKARKPSIMLRNKKSRPTENPS